MHFFFLRFYEYSHLEHSRSGCNSTSFARIKKIVVGHSPLVIAIIEPVVGNSNLLCYYRRLGYNEASSNTNGKLWLFWKRNTQLSIISQTDQLMHTTFGGYGDVPLHLTFVYAKCSYILRRSRWHDLITLLASFSGPCIVGGDFNVVRNNDEYFGSTPPTIPLGNSEI